METLRVLELYSGIGGMHYALKQTGISAQVVAAIDINTTANQIYKHNFPDTPLWNRTIEGIPLDEFNGLCFDVILMSPPCQPFTRLGLHRDVTDPRTKSFLYILDLLPRQRLVETLIKCSYTYQEVMVSPTSVGIPNSRLRYFLMAKLSTENISSLANSKTSFESSDTQPPSPSSSPVHSPTEEEHSKGRFLYKLETTDEVLRKMNQNIDLSVRQIQDFLEPEENVDIEQYLVAHKTLLRYALILDIVTPICRRSVCFTKGYGRYVEGTGSVLQSCMETEMESVFKHLDQCSKEEEKLQLLLKLKLRYFTPREVANLMGFPKSFSFPAHIPIKQRYKVLGNSLNVVVVASLLQELISS
ncbi:tRNA (cytosine(38)-C(5))-methyltransferase isoform X2 [Dunckerocampus dactyliophorus]|uniref:tRNA (cytosine(38)-C(5))-methyltransferase isoform X2 n=1 Tax=Dunckerocampus dactyliophorus TaxID=161453 RepID=UPI002405A9E3|nr:tRNA (cytosine(38)-C(5))-methyltransferase isoform X2 [Dunckerocampus dactyliophorus]